MKKLNNCVVENCIPTPSSCVEWNGGDIEYLGICNGDSLNNVVWEIITKLQELAGEDLASFDIDTLLDICNKKAPLEINLTTILTLLKDNEVCLKDYIDTLNDKINELSSQQGVSVNLKCYADFDNLGNALSITRTQLDQLVIDELCDHEGRIQYIEGEIVVMKNTIANIDVTPVVNELEIGTCVNPAILPTSIQVINTATAHCELEDATGTPTDISSALSNTPTIFGTPEYLALTGWTMGPGNLAENYSNLLIAFNYLLERVTFMEENCCASTCDDVKVGFTAIMNEDFDGVILRFTSGAGTSIPSGWTDNGSSVIITDIDGNTAEQNIVISNGAEEEVTITGLNMLGPLQINVTVKMTNGALTCEKCINRQVTLPGCNFCTITATDTVTIIYETTVNA